MDGKDKNEDMAAMDEIIKYTHIEYCLCYPLERESPHYRNDLKECCRTDIQEYLAVPISILDGSWLLDDSVLLGGSSGGKVDSLRGDVIEAINKEVQDEKNSTKEALERSMRRARQKPLNDVEMLETTMEHDIDYWVTTDYRKINEIRTHVKAEPGNNAMQLAQQKAVRPSDLLRLLQAGSI